MATAAEIQNVRLLIGDTDGGDQLLDDDDLGFFVDEHPQNPYAAAAAACGALAAKFARKVDRTVEDVSVKSSQLHAHYLALAKSLTRQAKTKSVAQGLPFAGGVSSGDKAEREADGDRVAPAFSKALHVSDGA